MEFSREDSLDDEKAINAVFIKSFKLWQHDYTTSSKSQRQPVPSTSGKLNWTLLAHLISATPAETHSAKLQSCPICPRHAAPEDRTPRVIIVSMDVGEMACQQNAFHLLSLKKASAWISGETYSIFGQSLYVLWWY